MAGLHSLGLLGMRERAQRLGGTFDIRAVPGDGAIVTVTIPVKSNRPLWVKSEQGDVENSVSR
ncbi:MAG: hypothetical protein KA765_06695 [Thermoflexales bacterium]|nr:hypothetical protein [Thermoflexales bacterium]